MTMGSAWAKALAAASTSPARVMIGLHERLFILVGWQCIHADRPRGRFGFQPLLMPKMSDDLKRFAEPSRRERHYVTFAGGSATVA